MGGEQTHEAVDIDPDLGVAFLLTFVKDQLHAEVQVDGLNVIDILLAGIAGAAHEADHVACVHVLPLGKTRGVGRVFSQVGVIVVAQAVVRADADPPAAVLIPAQRLDGAALHGDDGRSQCAEQVVSEMGAGKAIAALCTEVIVVCIAVARGNGGEGLQPVGWDPFGGSGFLVGNRDGIMPHQPAEHGVVGLAIVGKIFVLCAQQLFWIAAAAQLLRCLIDPGSGDALPAAAARRGQRKQVDPRKRWFLALRGDVQLQRALHGRESDVKFHPADVILLRGNKWDQQKNRKQTEKNPLFHKRHLADSLRKKGFFITFKVR